MSPSPRTLAWVESWNRVKHLPEDQLRAYLLGKCRNGFQMAKKPSRDQRDAWVTLLAEPDRTRDQLSPLAMRMVKYIRQRLQADGYDFELNLDDTGGIAYAEVHFRTLTRKTEAQASSQTARSARPKTRGAALEAQASGSRKL